MINQINLVFGFLLWIKEMYLKKQGRENHAGREDLLPKGKKMFGGVQ